MACFAIRAEGGLSIDRGRHCYVIFGRWSYEPRAKHGRYKFEFRGSANEMAIKGGAIRNRTPGYKLVQLVADHSFRIQANVCDPTKMIVKRSLQTLICSVVFCGSMKGSQ